VRVHITRDAVIAAKFERQRRDDVLILLVPPRIVPDRARSLHRSLASASARARSTTITRDRRPTRVHARSHLSNARATSHKTSNEKNTTLNEKNE
jgi:hypothetical protein